MPGIPIGGLSVGRWVSNNLQYLPSPPLSEVHSLRLTDLTKGFGVGWESLFMEPAGVQPQVSRRLYNKKPARIHITSRGQFREQAPKSKKPGDTQVREPTGHLTPPSLGTCRPAEPKYQPKFPKFARANYRYNPRINFLLFPRLCPEQNPTLNASIHVYMQALGPKLNISQMGPGV